MKKLTTQNRKALRVLSRHGPLDLEQWALLLYGKSEREATTKNRQIAIGNMAQAFKMDGLAWDWGDGWRISDKGRRAIS